jgi:hypothetical protein
MEKIVPNIVENVATKSVLNKYLEKLMPPCCEDE